MIGVELGFEGPTDDRISAHWSMAKIAMSESDNALNAQTSEISPVSLRRMTPEKSRRFDIMRDAVDHVPV